MTRSAGLHVTRARTAGVVLEAFARALLLLKYLQMKARFGWSLSNLVALQRMHPFVYRDLWTRIGQRFIAPPEPPELLQRVLL